MQSSLNSGKPGPTYAPSVVGAVVSNMQFKSIPAFEYSTETAIKVKAGLQAICNNLKPEIKSMPDNLYFIIGDHSIRISRSRVTVKNRVTSKTVSFLTGTKNKNLNESVAHALVQLRMMNKGSASRYRLVFDKPGEVFKFIDELRLKLDDLNL